MRITTCINDEAVGCAFTATKASQPGRHACQVYAKTRETCMATVMLSRPPRRHKRREVGLVIVCAAGAGTAEWRRVPPNARQTGFRQITGGDSVSRGMRVP
jgi:hypothetical protein